MVFINDTLINSYLKGIAETASHKLSQELAMHLFYNHTSFLGRDAQEPLHLEAIVSALTSLGFERTRRLKFEGVLIDAIELNLISYTEYSCLIGCFRSVSSLDNFINHFGYALGKAYDVEVSDFQKRYSKKIGKTFYETIRILKKSNAENFILNVGI